MNRVRNLLLLVVLAACAFSFWWARREPAERHAQPPPPPPRSATGEKAAPPPLSVHVAVLNGTGEAGLARRFSRRMPEHGCVVVAMADAPHDTFSRSILINRRLGDEQARDLAAQLGGLPVIREWDSRCREDAVVVLGRDHGRLRIGRDR